MASPVGSWALSLLASDATADRVPDAKHKGVEEWTWACTGEAGTMEPYAGVGMYTMRLPQAMRPGALTAHATLVDPHNAENGLRYTVDLVRAESSGAGDLGSNLLKLGTLAGSDARLSGSPYPRVDGRKGISLSLQEPESRLELGARWPTYALRIT